MAANPEAIAWYVERSEALLDDLRDRVQFLRIRGGRLSGFSGAVLRGSLLPPLVSAVTPEEVANFASRRFTDEPDLWRVHVRTIRSLLLSIESTSRQSDTAARAVRKAGRLFLGGLFAVGNALGILILVVTF